MGREFSLFPSLENNTNGDTSTQLKREINIPFIISIGPDLHISYSGKIILKIEPISSIESFQWWGDTLFSKIKIQKYFTLNFDIFCGMGFISILFESEALSPADFDPLIQIDREMIKSIENNFIVERSQNWLYIGHPSSLLNKLKSKNDQSILQSLKKDKKIWIENLPDVNQYVNQDLWNFSWILNHVGKTGVLSQKDECCVLPFFLKHTNDVYSQISNSNENLENENCAENLITSMTGIINIIEDLQWYDSNLASDYLINGFKYWFDNDTGIIKNPYSKIKNISHPPLWSFVLLELSKISGNYDLIFDLYEKMKKNLHWWEKNRFNEEYQLFENHNTPLSIGLETGMPLSPRFSYQLEGSEWNKVKTDKKRHLLPVDVNSQMCDFYQNMGVFSMIVGKSDANDYFQKAQNLQENAPKIFWDTKTKFYYDYDVDCAQIQPLKTIAGLWPLFGGLALKSHIPDIVSHITNPKEFWTELPIPSLSLDENMFSNEIWSGPVKICQDLWIITGLKRYNLNKIAAQISYKIINYLNNSFDLYHGLYQYYPSNSYNINSISINGRTNVNNNSLCFQNVPIHALFYQGLLGVEVLDNSINFVPDWSVLDKEIQFSLYYRKKKYEVFLSKLGKKYLEIPSP